MQPYYFRPIRQTAPPAVNLAWKLKPFLSCDLFTLPFLPFVPYLNGVTGHQCHGLPSCQFSACYALPVSTKGEARDRQTDRNREMDSQITAINMCYPMGPCITLNAKRLGFAIYRIIRLRYSDFS